MNVLVIGANGQIGRHLIDEMVQGGTHTPLAFVRKEEQMTYFKEKGVEARLGNLESSIRELEETMSDVDVIIFAAGSGGSTGSDKTLLVDLDGAVKVMEAAKTQNVNRFLIVSAFGAESRDRWSDQLKPYYVAKHFADEWLRAFGLNYTIVRPGMLENEQSIGTVLVEEKITDTEIMTIPRVDVAKVLLETIDNEQTYHKSFDLVTGETEIQEALNHL